MAIAVASSSKGAYDQTPPVVITAPTGITEGDILVAVCSSETDDIANITGPAGWTAVTGATSGGESARMFRKVAVSADESATDYSFDTSDGGEIGGVILRITGGAPDFSLFDSENVASGSATFSNMDITPAYANSLIVFGVFNYGETSAGVSGYAIATNNPSWTEAQEVAAGVTASAGPLGVAYAVRPETSATGAFSFSDNTNAAIGIALVLAPQLDVTINATPLIFTGTIPDATATGDANVTVTPLIATGTLPAATVTVQTNTVWTNETAPPETTWTIESL